MPRSFFPDEFPVLRFVDVGAPILKKPSPPFFPLLGTRFFS